MKKTFVLMLAFLTNMAFGERWIQIPQGLENDKEWVDMRGSIVCVALGISLNKPDSISWNDWVDKNVEQAKLDARKEKAEARFILGNCYNDIFRKKGEFSYNEEKAFEYYELAAKQGHVGAREKIEEKNRVRAQLLNLRCHKVGLSTNKPTSLSWDAWIEKGFGQLYTKAIDGDAEAQYKLGGCFRDGCPPAVSKDDDKAYKWFSLSAKQGFSSAQYFLGDFYEKGIGVSKNNSKSAQWYLLAAEQGNATAQFSLAGFYKEGKGVIEDYVEAYAWYLIVAMNEEGFSFFRDSLKAQLSSPQIAAGQQRAKELQSLIERKMAIAESESDKPLASSIAPSGFGSGLLVKGGYVLTCWHVVDGAERVSVSLNGKDHVASIVQKDAANDIAILKISDVDAGIALNLSDDVKLGEKVFTLGYPHPDLQGSDVKFTTGSISSLTGIDNSPRYFQISAPLQSGNSGGALFDEKGNLVGMVAAKLDSLATLAMTGDLPQNVNYAIKTDYLIPLLKTVDGLEAGAEKKKDVNLLELIEELKTSVVMIKVY